MTVTDELTRVVTIEIRPDLVGYVVELCSLEGAFPIGGPYATAEEALRVVGEALTAPLATEDRFKAYDEISGQVQSLMDEIAELRAAVTKQETLITFMQGMFAASQQATTTRHVAQDTPSSRSALRQNQVPLPSSLRDQEKPASLRRPLQPHVAVGGAMRGPASVQQAPGDPDDDQPL